MIKDINEFKKSLDKFINDKLVIIRYTNKNKCKPLKTMGIKHDECFNPEIVCANSRKLDDVLGHIDDTFQKALFYFIDSKNLDEVEVYKKAHIDRRLFSKIRSDEDFKPSKKTAISLCFGLKLNLDESLDLLAKAGFTLSHASRFDLIIEYFLKEEEYDLDILNQVLYDYGEDTLYI